MKVLKSVFLALTSLIAIGALVIYLTADRNVPDEDYYQTSEKPFSFDFKHERSFAQYQTEMTDYIRKYRVYYDQNNKEDELARITPYEMPIDEHCANTFKTGVLLVHGIMDTAFVLKDLARKLNKDCILVRGLLLPGHGTRVGDMLNVSKDKWIDTVNFGIRTLKQDVDHVYVLGYSLGGLLAAHALIEHPDLRGAILLSPALQITYSPLATQSLWVRYLRKWMDIDLLINPVRYISMPTNGIAELVELRLKTLSMMKRHGGLQQPIFAIISGEDISIHPSSTLKTLLKASSHANSQFIYYGPELQDRVQDPRVQFRDPFLPEERILNYSHLTFPYSPENPVYGRNGFIKECGENVGLVSDEDAAACAEASDPWKGELNSAKDDKYKPIQRLTYNPEFDRMMREIIKFIDITRDGE